MKNRLHGGRRFFVLFWMWVTSVSSGAVDFRPVNGVPLHAGIASRVAYWSLQKKKREEIQPSWLEQFLRASITFFKQRVSRFSDEPPRTLLLWDGGAAPSLTWANLCGEWCRQAEVTGLLFIKINTASVFSPERAARTSPTWLLEPGSYRRLCFINTSIMARPLAIRDAFKADRIHLRRVRAPQPAHLHRGTHARWHGVGCIFLRGGIW